MGSEARRPGRSRPDRTRSTGPHPRSITVLRWRPASGWSRWSRGDIRCTPTRRSVAS